jgi:lipoprotein-anchoring transpeptidase ErfK/SrfK
MQHIKKIFFISLALVSITTSLSGCGQKQTATSPKKTEQKAVKTPQYMNKIDWQKSSEKRAYPDFNKYPKAWIRVSLKDQRTYIMDGKKILYTMYASTGGSGDNATPTGTYYIQAERGHFFYNPESGEGAYNWVSWKDHGVYLFHSVPTDAQGNVIKSEAKQLGKTAKSHGCVRLTMPDSKWLHDNVPEGLKVVISKD